MRKLRLNHARFVRMYGIIHLVPLSYYRNGPRDLFSESEDIDFYQKGCDYFLVVLHSHSKWIEVQHLTVITTEKTINELSEEVVSDNEPQFISNAYEFAEFMHRKLASNTF